MTAPPMSVRRVVTDELGSSYIDPPLDPSWSPIDKLRWRAAVAAIDSGLDDIAIDATSNGPGLFNVHIGQSSGSGPFTEGAASTYLSGITSGAVAARRQAARSDADTPVGFFVHRPDEHDPHLTSPYGYAIANVYTSRAAARGAFGPMGGEERLYRVVEDDL